MPSRVILSMRYEPIWRQLLIVFRGGGGTYRYFDVPVEEWRAFLEAESKGTYLNEVFKRKKHRYEKVEAPMRMNAVDPQAGGEPLEWGEMWSLRRGVKRVEAEGLEWKVKA